MTRKRLLQETAARGKYAPLHRYLLALHTEPEWHASFGEVEAILGFRLPDSARLHRPWWSNRKSGRGHSHALAWQAAGWRTRAVDLEAERLTFERTDDAPFRRGTFSISETLPPHDPGPWPRGFTASREQIYGGDVR